MALNLFGPPPIVQFNTISHPIIAVQGTPGPSPVVGMPGTVPPDVMAYSNNITATVVAKIISLDIEKLNNIKTYTISLLNRWLENPAIKMHMPTLTQTTQMTMISTNGDEFKTLLYNMYSNPSWVWFRTAVLAPNTIPAARQHSVQLLQQLSKYNGVQFLLHLLLFSDDINFLLLLLNTVRRILSEIESNILVI